MEPNFFEAQSPYFDHPLLTPARTSREVEFLLSELQLDPGARMLDVGCGFGRHSIALAQRGFAVTGIDSSKAMIQDAEMRAAEAGVQVDFRQVRAEELTADQEFEAALCLFSTLGQISRCGENSGLIPRIFAALKPGGQFVLEVSQREVAVSKLKEKEIVEGADRTTTITRVFDPSDRTVTETFTITRPAGSQVFLLRYRLFSQADIAVLLAQAGFVIRAAYGDYAHSPLTTANAVMVFFATKPRY